MAFAVPTGTDTAPQKDPPDLDVDEKQELAVQDGSSLKRAAQSPILNRAPQEAQFNKLRRLLRRLISARPPERRFRSTNDPEDLAFMPVFWVSKWVDYTDKYGLGYQLSDNSIGVVFNDTTRIIQFNDNESVAYVDEDCIEHYHSLEEYPPSLEKKIILLKHFCIYMKKLCTTGEDVSSKVCADNAGRACVQKWLRTSSAMSFYLTNGTVQINFFKDHTKLILCPLRWAVTYIDKRRFFHTYRLEMLRYGCPSPLFCRLKYAQTILDRMTTMSC
nr:serine/threonine-protein kinase PLK1-like isoform X2 [Rhipicephalus microplus]